MSDWQIAGAQRFRVETDLVTWEVQGDITASELAQIFGVGTQLQQVHGYALFLICAEGAWHFPPPAREYLAKFHQQHHAVGATAIIGLSTPSRLFLELVLRAVGLVSGHQPSTRFFRTNQEGLIWLNEQRELGKKGLLKR